MSPPLPLISRILWRDMLAGAGRRRDEQASCAVLMARWAATWRGGGANYIWDIWRALCACFTACQ